MQHWTSAWLVAQTAPASSAAADAAPTSPPAANGMMDILLSGGWVGNLILLGLLGLSLTAAYLVFEQLLALRRKELVPDDLAGKLRNLMAAGQWREAQQMCRDRPSLISFLVLHGLAEVEGGWTAVEQAMEDTLAEQAARMYRKIEYLSVIGNLAPMVGLLGTVTGMIFAFQQVAASQGAAGAGDLAEGIYQALVTTVGGLLVAIPSLGAFAVFRNWVDQLVAEAAQAAQHAVSPLKRRRQRTAATTMPSSGER